jgi:aerobic C4-dicarboxylate transport protein
VINLITSRVLHAFGQGCILAPNGVTGSGFIVLSSTLAAIKIIPVEGLAILIGVDRFMSEARAITNVIGNGVATIVIAKSEGEFSPPSPPAL